jgi:hypothetical protein
MWTYNFLDIIDLLQIWGNYSKDLNPNLIISIRVFSLKGYDFFFSFINHCMTEYYVWQRVIQSSI